uniref:C-type lectin domain-containing protein n=1 Tax=Oncorhynchus kisutch TaxID=8019 RepID=A0A8C7I7T1_ONCKI
MQRKSSFTGLLITALCAVASGLTSKTYYHVDKILTWHNEEAELIFNIKEMEQVTWIGLYRDDNDPIGWKWSGVEDSEFRLWGKKEPNKGKSETCANVLDNVWIDTSCDNEHTFICYGGECELILMPPSQDFEG